MTLPVFGVWGAHHDAAEYTVDISTKGAVVA